MRREKQLEALLTITVGFAVLYLIFKKPYLLSIAVIIGLCGVFSKFLTLWISKGWFKFSELLGWINSRILLSAVFYVILFPVALLQRLTGKDALMLKKTQRKSFYQERNHTYTPQDIKNSW
jgi:hypothetical protein